MAQLDKLHIIGIRSFGPEKEDLQKIKFHSPLTLIQGQNGCGKTTIIEAIKFGITGDVPGGSARGQGFVYHPKLAKEYETRGQVRLRIVDANNMSVTATKSVCVTQRAKKLEFKRLDSTISRGPRGHKCDQNSGKCIDIDTEMCLSLGVPKPILNNVIFCHQEDSNWPLEDEGKKLKEKFDQIFDTAAYNKCLNTTHKIMKDRTADQKVTGVKVSNLLNLKKDVANKHANLKEKEQKLETLDNEIHTNNGKLKILNSKLEEICTTELNFSNLCAEVEIKKKDVDALIKQQKDILQNITEFSGSDEELINKVNKFEGDLLCLQTDIDILIAKKSEIEESEKKSSLKINEYQMKLGSFQTEEKQNDVKKENRNKLIHKSIKEFKLEYRLDEKIEEHAQKIILDLNENLENKKNNVKLLEISMEREEKRLQNNIDKIRDEYTKLKHNIVLKNNSISDLNDELRTVQHSLEELNSAGDHLKLADSKLNRLEKELSSLQASVNTDSLRSEIEKEKKKQKELEERRSVVDDEVQILQQYISLQTELDLKNEQLFQKQTEAQKLKNKHEKSLNHIFGNNVPKSDLKKSVETYQNIQNKLIREFNNQINEKQREVLKFENSLHLQLEKFNEKEKELTDSQKKLSNHCEDKDLQFIIDDSQNNIEELQKQKGVYYSSKYLFQKYIGQFEAENPSCPICKRHVEEKSYVTTIISELNKKIETFPKKMQEVENELTQAQKKYEVLLSLKPVSEKLQKLKEEVPLLNIEVENLKTNFSKSTEELEKLKNDIVEPQKNEKLANSIIGDVALIDQIQKELIRVKEEISSLSLQMPKTESNRGIQEAISEQESLKIDIGKIRHSIESSQNKLSQHVERLHNLKERKNELISQQLNIKKGLQGKDNLVTNSTEIEKKLRELETEIQELENQVKILKNTLDASVKEKEELQTKNREKMEDARTLFNALQKIIYNIKDYQKEIDDFNKKNITNQINLITEKITNIENNIKESSTKKQKIDKSVDELKTQITNSKINFRELQDNVKLREKRKEQIVFEKHLAELKRKLGDNDIKRIRQEKKVYMNKEASLQEITHKAEGKRTELRENIKDLKDELELPKNKEVFNEYKKKLLEYILTEKGIIDLKNFIKSLDWALMQFHKQRMIQINNIIKDLWRTIYKGNDIDYIEIKTDDITTCGADKRKLYNYRIVQVKNEIEMDMRGRCSAGQRVLASLIIRIALAETFSSNCGILALDEPTTNLDRDNINSLSEALVQLINEKKAQKNFQLLIITHDQDFVDKLTRSESLQSYYVVERNIHGKSVISEKY